MSTHSVVHNRFTLEREYPLPGAEVFEAWANPRIKARWFAGNSDNYTMDFRPGGLEQNRVVLPDGKRITWESLYREIVPDHRIVYTSVLSEGDTVATVSLTTVEFIHQGKTTRLVLNEAGAYLDGHEQPEWREEGTTSQLEALERHLNDLAQV
ncbi:MAG TPA: SRPBCC family protein [Galbitalea sp.]|jgi:uncharacterized protein YndB with AHSA1/START domain|nr:SRPBCC family protein [Galbitalea sp.]